MITHAFTCTGPYAILIMLGIKRVENRAALPSPREGRCALSCSKSFQAAEYGEFVRWASRTLSSDDFARLPSWGDVKDWPGKIVGCCDYSVRGRNDLVLASGDCGPQWDEGLDYFWDLSEVVCFDVPIPCRGAPGFWQMPPELAAHVSMSDRLAGSIGRKITTADDAERIFRDAVSVVGSCEGFFVLPLDSECRTLAEPILISFGESRTAVVRPSDVFTEALKVGAASVIVAHNHPSGSTTPSDDDVALTQRLIDLGRMHGIPLFDHLVLGSPGSEEDKGFASIRNLASMKF